MPSRRLRKPLVMVAPNGARLGKRDHPAIPLTADETAQTAALCRAAGADAVHAHVRDGGGQHVLDASLYRELIDAVARAAPGMPVQVTTESAGKYSPAQQRALLRALRPAWASVSVAEMVSDGDLAGGRETYFWAREHGVDLQHIVYSPGEVRQLETLVGDGIVPAGGLSVLFVLGRYSPPADAVPGMLGSFLEAAGKLPEPKTLMACAFGARETECLVEAAQMGCDCRVGFENNRLNSDGKVAADNAERVVELVAALKGALR